MGRASRIKEAIASRTTLALFHTLDRVRSPLDAILRGNHGAQKRGIAQPAG
jgi:hypothetical protein